MGRYRDDDLVRRELKTGRTEIPVVLFEEEISETPGRSLPAPSFPDAVSRQEISRPWSLEIFASRDRCVVRWRNDRRRNDDIPVHDLGVEILRARGGKAADILAYVKGGPLPAPPYGRRLQPPAGKKNMRYYDQGKTREIL
jgi:hypothetical protein